MSLQHIRAPRIKDEPRRALTDDELLRLLTHAGQSETGKRDRTIVMTLLVCGIRRGELCGLRLSDIDLRERRLHVRAATSKSGEARDVTLHLEAAKELDTYINDVREGDTDADAPLFTDRSGQALTGNAVRKLFDRLKVSTGIDALRAHAPAHLGHELPPIGERQPLRSAGRRRMAHRTDGRAIHEEPAIRRATTRTLTAHRVSRSHERKAACREAVATTGKRPNRNTYGMTTEITTRSCSPEGIRTPDLFLESDEVERSGLADCLRTNRYWPRTKTRVR
ncbi:MAG TPA: tyrosine-type recombinase/integrase [Candidatus Limnocylindria bacterium]